MVNRPRRAVPDELRLVDAEIGVCAMRFFDCARTVLGAVLLSSWATASVFGAPADYRFELAQAQPAEPGKTNLAVRLTHLPDKQPVIGAVVFDTKADMGPNGMADMT